MKKILSCTLLTSVVLLSGCNWINPYFRTTKPGHPELPPQQTIVAPNQQLPQTTIPDNNANLIPKDPQGYSTTCTVKSGSGAWSASSNDQGTALRNAMHKCKAGSKNPEQCVFSSCTGQ